MGQGGTGPGNMGQGSMDQGGMGRVGMGQRSASDGEPDRPGRWRSPLLLATMSGFVFALLSGSLLLFFGSWLGRVREFWGYAHWVLGLAGLAPYAVYQLRHYLRVRGFVRQTHYRVGLHAFFALCAALVTGLLLVTPLERGTLPWTVADTAHMFVAYTFVILLSAHLTLTGILTLARATPATLPAAQAALRWQLGLSAVIGTLLFIAGFFVQRLF